MKKRFRLLYLLALLSPCGALIIVAMRLAGGARWPIATALVALGWLAFLSAVVGHRRLRDRIRRHASEASEAIGIHLPFLAAALCLLLLASSARLFFPLERADFIGAEAQGLREAVDADRDMMRVYVEGLDAAVDAFEAAGPIHAADFDMGSADDKRLVLEHWSRCMAYLMQLEQTRALHKHFYQIPYLQHPDLNLRSFLVAFASFTASAHAQRRLVAAVGDRPHLAALLNEARDELDLPPRSLLSMKQGLTHPDTLALLAAGRANLEFLKASGRLTSDADAWLVLRSARDAEAVASMLGHDPGLFVEAPRDGLEQMVFQAWLPLQKGVAEGMSHVRTTTRENLISLDDIAALLPDLLPGDILLERRNWYLTNVGIPGFWPHVALYTGTLEEMDRYFASPEHPSPVSTALRSGNPELFRMLSAPSPKGHPYRVLEALAPGVVPTPLEISGRADYLAVLRPNLARTDKLAAILRAFRYAGRPYDYNFDFATDNELVCSELIFKSYAAGDGAHGLNLPLVETAGRFLLPPNRILRKFDEELDSSEPELAFVAFLDGSEKAGGATRKDAAALRSTWKRPKWDIAQD